MSNPKISVIVPVYNVEYYLEDALNSIVNQTFVDIEVLMLMMDQPIILDILLRNML